MKIHKKKIRFSFITFQSIMFTEWKVTACNVATFTPSTWGWGGGSCHITSCNCPPKGHYAMWRGITWHDHRTITSHERRHRDVHWRACLIVVVVAIVVGSFDFLCRKKNSVSLSQVKKPKLDSSPKSSKKKEKKKIWKGKRKERGSESSAELSSSRNPRQSCLLEFKMKQNRYPHPHMISNCMIINTRSLAGR